MVRRSETWLLVAVTVSLVLGMFALLAVLNRYIRYGVPVALVGMYLGYVGYRLFRRNSAHYSRQYQLLCWVGIGLNLLTLLFTGLYFLAIASDL